MNTKNKTVPKGQRGPEQPRHNHAYEDQIAKGQANIQAFSERNTDPVEAATSGDRQGFTPVTRCVPLSQQQKGTSHDK